MEIKRYHDRTQIEYEAVQLTPENMEEVAKHFELEYVKDYTTENGTEEVLFRPGYSDAIHIGDFAVRSIHANMHPFEVLASEFDTYFTEIQLHAFIPQVVYSSSELYPIPCVFCGHTREGVPYHRDPIPGEFLNLPDGGTLRITN